MIINSDESGPLSNWGFAMGYWIADGDPEPEVPFPKDWEVCGVPDFDPLAFRPEYKRHRRTTLAEPMYDVVDPLSELVLGRNVSGCNGYLAFATRPLSVHVLWGH